MAQGTALGNASYLEVAKQAVFGTAVSSGFKTISFLRQGDVYSNRKDYGIRASAATVMPKPGHVYEKVALVDVAFSAWWVHDDTLWLDLLTSAWGKRVKVGGAAPYNQQLTVVNPPNTDTADTGTTFYNHGLTTRLVEFDGTAAIGIYKVQDVNITRMELSCDANGPLVVAFRGTGQKETDDTGAGATAFLDASASLLAWNHLAAGANSGLYFGAANPPTTAMKVNKLSFALEQNLNFDIDLGAAAGLELARPSRSDYPAATVDVDMTFEDLAAGQDAVLVMTDFLASTARNFRAEWYAGANESVELLFSAAVAPCKIQNVKKSFPGNGRAGLSFQLGVFPNAVATDFLMNVSTGT
jgi:hypothetical protein